MFSPMPEIRRDKGMVIIYGIGGRVAPGLGGAKILDVSRGEGEKFQT